MGPIRLRPSCTGSRGVYVPTTHTLPTSLPGAYVVAISYFLFIWFLCVFSYKDETWCTKTPGAPKIQVHQKNPGAPQWATT